MTTFCRFLVDFGRHKVDQNRPKSTKIDQKHVSNTCSTRVDDALSTRCRQNGGDIITRYPKLMIFDLLLSVFIKLHFEIQNEPEIVRTWFFFSSESWHFILFRLKSENHTPCIKSKTTPLIQALWFRKIHFGWKKLEGVWFLFELVGVWFRPEKRKEHPKIDLDLTGFT